MSGIYIPGMEMPKSCWDCGALHEEDYCYAGNMSIDRGHSKDRSKYCPLVEVPDHGRLIDADTLKEKYPHDEDWNYPVNTNSFVVETINNAPTIIPADKDGAEC